MGMLRSFTRNPFDGYTLAAQLEQTTNLLQDLNRAPKQVDLGYREVKSTYAQRAAALSRLVAERSSFVGASIGHCVRLI